MSQEPFWKSRLASEAVGLLLLLAGLLAALSLASYDPHDPNIFSWTAGGEAASPTNWIGGAGASLAAALYSIFGLAAWGATALLFVLGWRRFWARPLPNPGTKAAGFGLGLVSVPMLLALTLGHRRLRGEDMDTGGVVGRAFADAFRSRIGTTGAVLCRADPRAARRSAGDAGLPRGRVPEAPRALRERRGPPHRRLGADTATAARRSASAAPS